MIAGSFIAGASAEGGGAVAFPVLTLLFDVQPFTARNFSLFIQSFGMTMASVTILALRIPYIKNVILPISFGGIIGFIFCESFLYELLSAKLIKLLFVSLSCSFALSLVKSKKLEIKDVENINNKIELLLLGFIGGVFSGYLGTGVDIISFAYLRFKYKFSAKIITPTSVILMATNSIFAVLWILLQGKEVSGFVFSALAVSVPIVIVFAPLGAMYISQRSKEFIEKFLIFFIFLQFITALLVIPLEISHAFFISFVILSGLGALNLINRRGSKHSGNENV